MTSEQGLQECQAEIRRLRGVARIQGEALDRIQAWDGDCVDHPDHIGSPNPKEIAAQVQKSIDEAGLA